ncbi:hypothetical protein [Myxococcus xanthus]|uniref:hypothetical protein n=1 Tax=Myxococcus xanthus TaxID=34 RepID=UPI0011276850|nr:hypothetical protein [Myxococcus xanthus]
MSGRDTRKRILSRLYVAAVWVSRPQLRGDITGITEETFEATLEALRGERLIALGKGQGGRVALTELGIQTYLDGYDDSDSYEGLGEEKSLYPIVKTALEARSGTHETLFVDTSMLRMRRGQWTNPDLMQISIIRRPLLRQKAVQVSSYEVKPWHDWSIKGVFEAAAHSAVFHRSWLILEWAHGLPWDPGRFERWAERMLSECGRFGVGLMTLHPKEKAFCLRTHLRAKVGNPDEQVTEAMLEYYLGKKNLLAAYNGLVDAGSEQSQGADMQDGDD